MSGPFKFIIITTDYIRADRDSNYHELHTCGRPASSAIIWRQKYNTKIEKENSGYGVTTIHAPSIKSTI